METDGCPLCKASGKVTGTLLELGTRFEFRPRGLDLPPWELGVPIACKACLSCGHVWMSLSPDALRSLIKTRGSELARQQLDELQYGRDHDLPDSSLARIAAERAREIDALVLHDKHVEAIRRFHDLTKFTWDQCLETMRGWRDLSRAKKLALFGWAPKGKPEPAGAEASDHPMRDRWLDGEAS
jgi:hypothetical protein